MGLSPASKLCEPVLNHTDFRGLGLHSLGNEETLPVRGDVVVCIQGGRERGMREEACRRTYGESGACSHRNSYQRACLHVEQLTSSPTPPHLRGTPIRYRPTAGT